MAARRRGPELHELRQHERDGSPSLIKKSARSSTPFYQAAVLVAGAPSGQWVDVEVAQVGKEITWKINGTVILQQTNSASFTSGVIMLGHMDTFASIGSQKNYVIFDNLRVVSSAPPPRRSRFRESRCLRQSSGDQLHFDGWRAAQFTVESASSVSGPYAKEARLVKSGGIRQFRPRLPGQRHDKILPGQALIGVRRHEPGRDGFHSVPDFSRPASGEIRDAVERVPTRFMSSMHEVRHRPRGSFPDRVQSRISSVVLQIRAARVKEIGAIRKGSIPNRAAIPVIDRQLGQKVRDKIAQVGGDAPGSESVTMDGDGGEGQLLSVWFFTMVSRPLVRLGMIS